MKSKNKNAMISEAQNTQLAVRLKTAVVINYLKKLIPLHQERNKLKIKWYKEKKEKEKKIIQIKLDKIELEMINLRNEYLKDKERKKNRLRGELEDSTSKEIKDYRMALKPMNNIIKKLKKQIEKEELIYKKIIAKYNN